MTKKQQPTVKQEQEAIISLLTGTKKYVKDHKKRVLTGAVILVLAAVFGYAYTTHIQKVQENSWAAYYNAQLAVMQNPAAVTQLDGVALQYPGTQAAQYAQLLKGDILYAGENFAQAADAYEPLTNAHNETLRTVATLSLAAAKQATGDYESAIKLMTQFIAQNPKSFALPQAYFTLAMSQELAGQKAQAVETYQQILANYTKTYFGKVAQDKLAVLNK